MDGAGIAVEIMEEIPIGEVSTMVMPSATGMATMQEETASLAVAAVIMAAVAAKLEMEIQLAWGELEEEEAGR